MLERTFLRALILGGTASVGDRHGVPAVTVDADILDAVDLDRLERIELRPVDGSWQATPFVLRGPRGSGEIRVDGPTTARLSGDTRVVITAWAAVDRAELATVRARIVTLSSDNRILEKLELGLVDEEELGARV
jgi:aspartate 1-decarboxylase